MQCKRRSTLSVTQISHYIKGANSSIVLTDLWDNNSLLAQTSVGRFIGNSLASSWGGRPWHLHLHRSLGQARKWLGAWPSVGWLRSDVEQGAVVLPLNDIKSPGKAEAAPVLPAYCPANSAVGAKVYNFTMPMGSHIQALAEFRVVLLAASKRIWVCTSCVGSWHGGRP